MFASALALLLPVAAAAAATYSTNAGLSVAVPPGWSAKPPDPSRPQDIFVLLGPRRHSCVLTALRGRIDFDNRAVLEAQMWTVVMRLNQATRLQMRPVGRLHSATYSNGAVVDYLVAGQQGRPPLLAGLCRFHGRMLLVTLVSAEPQEMLQTVAESLVVGEPLAEEGAPTPADASSAGSSAGRMSRWFRYLLFGAGLVVLIYGGRLARQYLRSRSKPEE